MMKSGFAQVCLHGEDRISFDMGGMFLHYEPEGLHTPLYASAWGLEAGSTKAIWVSADIILFDEEAVRRIRRDVAGRTGLSPEHILVSATHTHTGPNTANVSVFHPAGDQGYLEPIYAKVADACALAWRRREPVRMGCASANAEKCGFNRRWIMKNGESRMHPGGPENSERLAKEGPDDNLLTVAWFENESGPVGVIANISGHPSGMYGMHVVSADYPGVLRRTVQGAFGDIPVLFLLGFSGNTTNIDHGRDASWGAGIDGAERVGKILGAHAIRLMAGTRLGERDSDLSASIATGGVAMPYRCLSQGDIESAERTIKAFNSPDHAAIELADLAFANKVKVLEKKRAEGDSDWFALNALRLGDALFLTCPSEIFVEFQLSLKERFPDLHVICASITNGWHNYIPTRQAYLLGGYETSQGLYDWRGGYMIEEELARLGKMGEA